jgi:hypothetical protein
MSQSPNRRSENVSKAVSYTALKAKNNSAEALRKVDVNNTQRTELRNHKNKQYNQMESEGLAGMLKRSVNWATFEATMGWLEMGDGWVGLGVMGWDGRVKVKRKI